MDLDILYNLELKTLKNNKFKLIYPYSYKDVIVPKNFVTNGADYFNCCGIKINRFAPKILPAVVIHDYLCNKEEYKKADLYFKEILQIIDNKSFKFKFMAFAVKFYHKYIKRVY